MSADGQAFSLEHHRMRPPDFARAYAVGRRAHGRGITVVVLENGLPHSRMGLSVSKKRAKLAVRRNRIRRVFREAFRLERAGLPAGLDVVMIATSGDSPDLSSVRAELAQLVPKARAKPPRRPPVKPEAP